MRLGTMAQTQRSAQRWQQSSSSGQSGAQCALRPTTRHATCPAAEKLEWQARRRLAVLIRSHLYCCELHSEAHLIEPCETPGGAPGSNAGGAVRETPTLTFDDVSRAIGGLGGGKPRRTGVRFAVHEAVGRALNDSGASSFAEAFRIFEAERPDWQREAKKYTGLPVSLRQLQVIIITASLSYFVLLFHFLVVNLSCSCLLCSLSFALKATGIRTKANKSKANKSKAYKSPRPSY